MRLMSREFGKNLDWRLIATCGQSLPVLTVYEYCTLQCPAAPYLAFLSGRMAANPK
jgi:hypothetical protein